MNIYESVCPGLLLISIIFSLVLSELKEIMLMGVGMQGITMGTPWWLM